jgi:hypothetical protein
VVETAAVGVDENRIALSSSRPTPFVRITIVIIIATFVVCPVIPKLINRACVIIGCYVTYLERQGHDKPQKINHRYLANLHVNFLPCLLIFKTHIFESFVLRIFIVVDY